MNVWHRLKKMIGQASPRIDAEASRSDVERAIVVRWGGTATIKRTPLKWREKGKSE